MTTNIHLDLSRHTGRAVIGASEQDVLPSSPSIHGTKYRDLNLNGVRDIDIIAGAQVFTEPGLDGWTIHLFDSLTGSIMT